MYNRNTNQTEMETQFLCPVAQMTIKSNFSEKNKKQKIKGSPKIKFRKFTSQNV